MTLLEWLTRWPETGRATLTLDGQTVGYVVPDRHYHLWRGAAWDLDDYRVSAVSGGSIWFVKRTEGDVCRTS